METRYLRCEKSNKLCEWIGENTIIEEGSREKKV